MQKRNGDGWGIMWLRNNHIRTFKSSEATGLWEKYQELKEFNPIIHLRWKTHGDIDHDNTHPHYCGHGIYLMHNGVVSTTIRDQAKSDSWHLAVDYLQPLFRSAINPHKMIRHPEFRTKFEQIIGPNNRIVLGDRGGYVFYNMHQWHKVTNEDTGIAGLLVSNTYAWDAYSYGKSPKVYELRKNKKPRLKGKQGRINFSNGEVSYQNAFGMEMHHILGNLYLDDFGNQWELNAHGFEMCQKRSVPYGYTPLAEKKLLPTTPSVILPTNTPIASNDPITTAYEYATNLVKTYTCSTRPRIEALVYTTPDDAVALIYELTRRTH